MTVRMASNGLLDYTLAPTPDPVTASPQTGSPERRRLDLTVRGRTVPAWCSEITLAIPYGAGETTLTPEGKLGDIRPPGLPNRDWEQKSGSPRKMPDGRYLYTFVPRRGATQLTDTTTLVFALSNIEINKKPGEFTITVTETTSDTQTGTYTVKTSRQTMEKFGPGFLFGNLQPSSLLVNRGESVKLSWNARNAKIAVYWGTETAFLPDRDDQGNVLPTPLEWTSPPLTTPTGFMVRAQDTTGTGTRSHALTTTVFVDLPDLRTGNLAVTGTTTLLHTPANHTVTNLPRTYHVPTDGLAMLTARSLTDGRDAVGLLRTTRDGEFESRAEAHGTYQHPGHCLLPIPSGAQLEIQQLSGGDTATFTLTWFPLGHGQLTPPGPAPLP